MTKYEQAPNKLEKEMERRPVGPEVTSLEQALDLIGGSYEKAGAPESDIRMRDDGTFYIMIAELEGPVETIKWAQEFPLQAGVFDELLQKDYVRKSSPTSWGISFEGIVQMRKNKGTA